MNSFREKLINYVEFLAQNGKANKYYITLSIISWVGVIFWDYTALVLPIIFLFAIPIIYTHLSEHIEHKPKYLKIDKLDYIKSILKNFVIYNKHYFKKYFKNYMIFLITLSLSYIIVKVGGIISFVFLVKDFQSNIGVTILMLFSTYITIEGIMLMFVVPFMIVVGESKCLGVFKSIWDGKKLSKKKIFKHMVNLCVFAVFTSPLIYLSDMLAKYPYFCYLLITLYVLNLINYSLFDIKTLTSLITLPKEDVSLTSKVILESDYNKKSNHSYKHKKRKRK